jgi:hypothetical protein
MGRPEKLVDRLLDPINALIGPRVAVSDVCARLLDLLNQRN